jgi:hypothetical protein
MEMITCPNRIKARFLRFNSIVQQWKRLKTLVRGAIADLYHKPSILPPSSDKSVWWQFKLPLCAGMILME